jgi:Domain of unknown function (DUF3472)
MKRRTIAILAILGCLLFQPPAHSQVFESDFPPASDDRVLASDAMAEVLPGGMTSSYFDLPSPLPNTGNQIGYRSIESHLTVLYEPNLPGLSGHIDYFWAAQFWFDGGDGGYIGLQSDGIKQGAHVGKMAIVSIWDARDAEPPENCEEFGGEGIGYSCRVEYPWIAGREYRLRVEEDCCESSPGENEWWAASIRDISAGQDTYIGRILMPGDWNWLKNGNNAFAEFYGPIPTCFELPLAIVRWRDFEAEGGRYSAQAVTAQTYGDCASVTEAWCDNNTCYHKTGVTPKPRLPSGRVSP